MSNFYLYADRISREILLDNSQKVVLIGSDFGNGNFGDVLQHVNALKIVKKSNRFTTISVFSAHAISRQDFPINAKQAYGSDATIFVADYPLILDHLSPNLELVGEICNLAAIYLYGGGFMNQMWGDYVLGVTEYFLRLAPHVAYLVSGQQITPPYQSRIVNHIAQFKPTLFGVRDELSQQILYESGFVAQYSFDDATEALLDLTKKLPLQKGPGILMHLNASNYTANDEATRCLSHELSSLKQSQWNSNLTLFQAFKDIRHEVYDSRESIKKLDIDFPFSDLRLIELATYAYANNNAVPITHPVIGEIGYSCSYHVALWLQLSGIPCWLHSSNSFYDQKSKALQVTQTLEKFIKDPLLANHQVNLEQRYAWNDLFQTTLDNIPQIKKVTIIPAVLTGPEPWPFFFKGTPTLEEKLKKSEDTIKNQCIEIDLIRKNLQDTHQRLDAYVVHLTEIGCIAHEQEVKLEIASNRVKELDKAYHDIVTSTSWSVTRPLRIMMDFYRVHLYHLKNRKYQISRILKQGIKHFAPLRFQHWLKRVLKKYKS